jgi:serine/threonine protein kinase/Flp pilus assembly protein TadD
VTSALDPERRARIEALFDAALELPGAERAGFVARQAGEDELLRDQVLALLGAHEQTGLLDHPLPPLVPPAPPPMIGPWRLIELLGRGGMGEVWLAERADGQYRQRAAVKLLHPGADLVELRRRFLMERQILATLNHPNIAQLLDGGIAADGRPYLVMEYIDGLRIDRYCDRGNLPIRDRLRLVATVARAVHRAHRSLIVHRDLKPSNILVTGDGVPKLLDFGIAKLLDGSALGLGAVAQTESGPMTPEYASPEQIRNEPITTATDIYSLGVVLYELLSGRRPSELAGCSRGDWERILCEEAPPAPSDMVARGMPESAAATRGTTSGRLRRQLQGDLDRIVLMALRKEPHRRYDSAEQLAQDIERFLDGQPVLAHGDSRWYRIRKFTRRHKASVLAAGLTALALLVGAGLTLWQARIAARERDRAQLQREQAEEVSTFFVSLFDENDPVALQGDSITAAELLDRGRARAEELTSQPLVQARMLSAIAEAYSNETRYDVAESLATRALTLRRAAHGSADDPDVAMSLVQLGTMLRGRGAFREADSLYRVALAIQVRYWGEVHPEPARIHALLGYLAIARGRVPEAEAHYRHALDLIRRAAGDGAPEVATIMVPLGSTLRREGKYAEAEAMYRGALAIQRRAYPGGDPQTAETLLRLGDLYNTFLGRPSDAEPLIREAIAIQTRLLGPDDPRTQGGWSNLADFLASQGDVAAAERIVRHGTAVTIRRLGEGHPRALAQSEYLAALLSRQGRMAEAESIYRRSVQLQTELLGERNPMLMGTLVNLAALLEKTGRVPEAIATLERAIDHQQRLVGSDHPSIAQLYRLLAAARRRVGDIPGADTALAAAAAVDARLRAEPITPP